MNGFCQLLWKEWREHRATLLVSATFLPPAMGLWLGLFVPPHALADPVTFYTLGMVPALVFLLAIGGDVLGGRGLRGLAFLERMPIGLPRTFGSKVTFFLVCLVGSALMGLALVAAISSIRGELPRFTERALGFQATLLAGSLTAGLWCFAVSSWVPRGSLALPVSLGALAILLWPLSLFLAGNPIFEPGPLHVWCFLGLSMASSLVVAWLSLRHGRRFGRGACSSAKVGAVVSLLLLGAPASIWAAHRVHVAYHPYLSIQGDVSSDQEGNLYFLSKTGRGWTRAVVWKARSGDFEPFGPLHARFVGVTYDPLLEREQVLLGTPEGTFLIDLETDEAQPTRLESLFRFTGYGYKNDRGWYDPFLDRFFDADSILDPPACISSAGWLMRHPVGAPLKARWSLLDPRTGSCRALDWPIDARIKLVTPEMAFVVSYSEGAPFLFDLQSLAATPVQSDVPYEGIPIMLCDRYPIFRTSDRWLTIDLKSATLHELPVSEGPPSLVRYGGREMAFFHDAGLVQGVDLAHGSIQQIFPPVTTAP